MARGPTLTADDKVAIRAGIAAGAQPGEIAMRLGRAEQTVRNFAVKHRLRFTARRNQEAHNGRQANGTGGGKARPPQRAPRTPEDAQAILAGMAVDPTLAPSDRIRALGVFLDTTRKDGGGDAEESAKRIALRMQEIRADALAGSG